MRFFDRKRELADLKEIRKRSEEVAAFQRAMGEWRRVKPSFLALSMDDM